MGRILGVYGCWVIVFLIQYHIVFALNQRVLDENNPFVQARPLSSRSISRLFPISSCPRYDSYVSNRGINYDAYGYDKDTAMLESDVVDLFHIKPEDVRIIGSMGDSFTTGLFAGAGYFLNPTQWKEYPGVAFGTGADPGAATLANFFKHYQPNQRSLLGSSTGVRHVKSCLGVCSEDLIYLPETDGLNAGISGGKSSELELQYNYLNGRLRNLIGMEALEPEPIRFNDWKFITIFIGINDLCALGQNALFPDDDEQNKPGHPKYYKRKLVNTLESLRRDWNNTIVQLVELFDISEYASVVEKYPQCQHIDWVWSGYVCSCVHTENGRRLMKERIKVYNKVLEDIWRLYRTNTGMPKHDNFVVLLSPAMKQLNFTTDFHASLASTMDCTHPSTLGHSFIATALWNQLYLPHKDKPSNPFRIPLELYCPGPDDYIQVL
jgi:phospholipase B1